MNKINNTNQAAWGIIVKKILLKSIASVDINEETNVNGNDGKYYTGKSDSREFIDKFDANKNYRAHDHQ